MEDDTSKERTVEGGGRRFFFSLRSRMLFYFGLTFAVILVIIKMVEIYGAPFTAFEGEYKDQQREIFNNLNTIADLKKERLMRWLADRQDDARVLAKSGMIKKRVKEICALYEKIEHGGRRETLKDELRKEEAYRELTQHLKLVSEAYGVYETIMIADARTGAVIISTRSERLGEDVSDEEYFLDVLSNTSSTYINIIKEADENSRFFLYVARAITDREEPDAVLIMLVQPDDFIAPMLHTGKGLGATGEALLVDHDSTILTSLKYPLKDGSTAKPLGYGIKAKPAMLAARGEEGITTSEDYRGVPVLAAYRHIHISPGVGWGMVVKIDRGEIFAPLRRSVLITLLIGLAGLLAVFGLSITIANRLSRPMTILSHTARQVVAGNLEARAKISASHEIGVFADVFNSMITRLRDWHDELEEEVRQRTEELRRSNESLETEINVRKHIERQLKKTMTDLERSNEELQQFAYVASHDLKEPLRMVTSYVQLLERRYKDKLDADANEFIAFAVDGALRMQRLINDLLTYSRIGTQGRKLQPTDCEVIFEQTITNLRPAIEESGARITHDPLPTISADPSQILQLFQNLIGNAIKFSGHKQLKVHLSAERKDDHWLFSVSDNGIGIKPEFFNRIFVIFQRLHGKEEYSGSGMGLAICKKIVERHGGRIWVESEPGKGTIFYFTIPTTGDYDHEYRETEQTHRDPSGGR
jgi:signal transduction histidine kinase